MGLHMSRAMFPSAVQPFHQRKFFSRIMERGMGGVRGAQYKEAPFEPPVTVEVGAYIGSKATSLTGKSCFQ